MPTGDLFAAEASTKARSEGAAILAHCDGGARGNPGPAGYGAVIAAEDGTVLAELSEFLGFKTNNFAEYSGLLGVLQWALDHGHRRVKVVSDSELMVKQIQGKYKVNSPTCDRSGKKRSGALRSWSRSTSATPCVTRTRPPTAWPTKPWTAARADPRPPLR